MSKLQRNPLSMNMIDAITNALSAAENDTNIRAIVIASDGPVFSAGHDLKEMGQQGDETLDSQIARMRLILNKCATMMQRIVHSPKAIIACVQGTATAAGCQLVAMCDLAIAADTATFCTPGVNIGGFCTTPLVGIGRNVHRKHAMELALTGDAICAEKAEKIGLINLSISADQLVNHVRLLAERIALKSAQGIRLGKSDFYRQIEMPLAEAFGHANEAMIHAMTSADAQEGHAAFIEKRLPQWGGA